MSSASKESAVADVPPYASYRSFTNFLESLRAAGAVPSRIDKSVMATLNHGTRTALMSALRALGLISEGDKPTEDFERLVAPTLSDDDRKSIMRTVLTRTYPYLWNNGFNLERASSGELFERFRTGTKATGSTVDRAVIFFVLAATEAGVALSPHLTKGRTAATTSGPKRAKVKRQRARAPAPDMTPPPPPPIPSRDQRATESPDRMDRLLDKFPAFDPKWSEDMQTKWFGAFDLLAKRLEPQRGPKKGTPKE